LEAKLIAAAYERGGALSMASHVEIDDVIEPTETRARLIAALDACPVVAPRTTKKRPMVDTW
jgi:acetyl-CoA carboxylase carboxyltransferase component